jgi:hypothetical protein
MLAAMTDPTHAHLELDLIVDADPIAGLVHGEGEPGRPFTGWMELTRTIELSLAAARNSAKATNETAGP